MSEYKIQFQGFKPSTFFQKYVKFNMERILDEAPRNAFLIAHFSRSHKKFKAFVQILAGASKHYAIAEDDKFRIVIRKIHTQLKKKFERKKLLKNKINYSQDKSSMFENMNEEILDQQQQQ